MANELHLGCTFLTSGHSKHVTLANIHPFTHTFTRPGRCQPRRATASSSSADGVRRPAWGHLGKPATFQLQVTCSASWATVKQINIYRTLWVVAEWLVSPRPGLCNPESTASFHLSYALEIAFPTCKWQVYWNGRLPAHWHTHTHTHTRAHAHAYAHTHARTHTHAHTHAPMHACMHTHIQTQTPIYIEYVSPV